MAHREKFKLTHYRPFLGRSVFCGKKSGCFEKALAQRVRGSRRAKIKSSPTDAI
jgi:hypothetical protein